MDDIRTEYARHSHDTMEYNMAATTSASTVDAAYRQATEAPFSEVVRTLEQLLSRRLTAVIAGVKEGRRIARWAAGETTEARSDDKEVRLRTAYRIALMLLQASNSPQIVKAWFMGLNPQLDDVSP